MIADIISVSLSGPRAKVVDLETLLLDYYEMKPLLFVFYSNPWNHRRDRVECILILGIIEETEWNASW